MKLQNETSRCSKSSPGTFNEKNGPANSGCYFEIRVRGQLSDLWADWFEGLAIRQSENGEMLLSGPIADQAALMGVLNKLSRLNLTLLSLNEISRTQKEKK